jgi:hypothetical protein
MNNTTISLNQFSQTDMNIRTARGVGFLSGDTNGINLRAKGRGCDFQKTLSLKGPYPKSVNGLSNAVPSGSPRISKGSGFCQNFDLEPSLTVGLLLGQNRPNHFSGKVA